VWGETATGSEHGASCAKAINDYCAQEGWINIVVTCRAGEYADLAEAGAGLTIPPRQVVTLAPLEAGLLILYGQEGVRNYLADYLRLSIPLGALWSGLKFGLGHGAILGLVFGLILSGLAWLRHYVLRLLLYLDRRQDAAIWSADCRFGFAWRAQ
jgi:hypothetical protein